jgi:glycosyltransferase involved in cell wall biosynthesis
MKKSQKVVVMMPGYNVARTIADTFKEIPEKYRKHVILVDDGSSDNTLTVSKKLGIKVFSHPNNLGYGGAQKTGYWEALKLNPDVIVMLHPDYQYDATMMPYLIQPILDGKFDYMFGSRIATKNGALKGGMPLYKYILNRMVCLIQNILLGVNFSEHFSGYRAYSKRFLKTVPFQRFSNDFVFDQEMTISAISYGMRIGEIPIPTRYHEKQSSIKFLKGTKFILEGFWTIFKYLLQKAGILNDRRFAPTDLRKKLNVDLLAIIASLIIVLFLKLDSALSIWFRLFIFFQTASLYFLLRQKLLRKHFISLLVVVSILLNALLIIRTGIYKDNFTISRLEENTQWTRQVLYRRELGLITRYNTIALAIKQSSLFHYKFMQKEALVFDLTNYFSVENKPVYPLVFLPLFIVGLIILLSAKVKPLIFYFGLSVLSAIFVKPELAYLLLIPLINSVIIIGIINLKVIFGKKSNYE